MAKSGKSRPNQPSAARSPRPNIHTPKTQRPPKDWLKRPATESEADPLLRKIFRGVAVLGFVMLVGLSFGSGINADDKFQVDYSQKLVNWYTTFGKDTSALNVPDGNMHLYGGFFEVATGFANKAFGFEPGTLAYFNVRHVSSAILGWIAILCAALFAQRIAGWRAGIITLIIMLLSPRFVGDSLMNPKDIPFAAGYIMAIYNMAAVLEKMPYPRRWNVIGLWAGLAIALAMRAGGLLLFAILGLFAGLHFLLKNDGIAAFSNGAVLKKYALLVLGTAAAGYATAVLFWPYAMQAPLRNPFLALSKFADLDFKIRVLYDGTNVMSDQTPWHYPLKWILFTIPLATIAGFAGSLVWLPQLWRKYNPLWLSLALFATVFPVFYVIYKNAVLYDGWRHLAFIYPALAVTAGIFWNELANILPAKKYMKGVVYGALGILLLDAGGFIATNPKYPYLYFNPIIGGIKGAYGKFETDYWGVSMRQGIAWLEQQGILRPGMPEAVVIATDMYFPERQLADKYGDKVKIKPLQWERRCDSAWDYGLFTTRFRSSATLQKGIWPPDNVIHTVTAAGTPILAILQDNGKNCFLATSSFKSGDWPAAVEGYKAELSKVPDNEVAWIGLSLAYLNQGRLEESKASAEKAIEISPDDPQANNLIGIYWMKKNNRERAKAQFELALKRNDNNPMAWYYLAIIAREQRDNQTALANLMKAIELAPNFSGAYEMSAQIYEALGNSQAAQQFRAAIGQSK